MIEAAEQASQPEKGTSSNRLILYVGHGKFDATQPPPTEPFNEVSENSKKALQKQNAAIRKADMEIYTEAVRNQEQAEQKPQAQQLSEEEIYHSYFITWKEGALNEFFQNVSNDTQDNQAVLMAYAKLGISVTNEAELANLPDLFYNEQTQTPGEFYNKFCGLDSCEKIASVLSFNDMHAIKDFIVKWIVGTEDGFNALVKLREAENSKGKHLTPESTLPETAKSTLTFFRDGHEKTGDELVQQYKRQRSLQPVASQEQEPSPAPQPAQKLEKKPEEKDELTEEVGKIITKLKGVLILPTTEIEITFNQNELTSLAKFSNETLRLLNSNSRLASLIKTVRQHYSQTLRQIITEGVVLEAKEAKMIPDSKNKAKPLTILVTKDLFNLFSAAANIIELSQSIRQYASGNKKLDGSIVNTLKEALKIYQDLKKAPQQP